MFTSFRLVNHHAEADPGTEIPVAVVIWFHRITPGCVCSEHRDVVRGVNTGERWCVAVALALYVGEG